MKNKTAFSVFIGLFFTILSFQTQAQVVLYGLTSGGGDSNVGTVFSITATGNFTLVANLREKYAAIPMGSLLYANDGNFYASSVDGGFADSCTIFRCTPNGTLKTMIQLDTAFNSVVPAIPNGNSLIQALDGNLYGMTTMGGPSSSSYGVLFRLDIDGSYSVLHFFSGTDGSKPCGGLIQTSDSMLWGMTGGGGAHNRGTIFHCTQSGVFTSVFSFNALDGIYPGGNLLLANDGNFYGITYKGGLYGYGTIFRYNPSGVFAKLVDFDSINGSCPVLGSLIQATDNNLYGMTAKGGNSGNHGTLFRCTLSGTLTKLVNFNDTNGANPQGSLMQASDSYLYGMTYSGGKYGYGTIFQYSLTNSLSIIFDFDTTSGENPFGNLIEVDSLKETGINNIANENTTTLFPNPNNGLFTVACHSQSPVIMEVYNILGEKIFTETLGSAQTNNVVDMGAQPNGVYLYRVLNENEKLIGEGKLIIQK